MGDFSGQESRRDEECFVLFTSLASFLFLVSVSMVVAPGRGGIRVARSGHIETSFIYCFCTAPLPPPPTFLQLGQ